MKTFVESFVKSVNEHDCTLLPLADRFYATENGIPAAPLLMETYRMIDKVKAVGTVAEDPEKKTVYAVMSVLEGTKEVILGVRMTGENEMISELEINIYRSRSDTGFWFAVQEIENLEPVWDKVIPEEQRADRATLEHFAAAIFDNQIDGSEFPPAETCQLMEAGGLVYENVGYAKLLAPNPDALEIPEGQTRIPMGFGLGPIRPFGEDARLLCVDVEKGLVVTTATMDGYVSPYIVSDETSSCFVPVPMIGMHRSTLTPGIFEGQKACREMFATAENTTIAKFYDGKIQYLTQNIKIRPYGCKASWREDVFVEEA